MCEVVRVNRRPLKGVGGKKKVERPRLGGRLGIIGRTFAKELHQPLLRPWQDIHDLVRRKYVFGDRVEGDRRQLKQFTDLFDGKGGLCSEN